MADDLPVRTFTSQAALDTWLAKQKPGAAGIWLKIAKGGNDAKSVTRAEAIESALKFGWIDGQGKSADAGWWMFRFTPRRARSKWSKINRAAALKLIADGKMQPAGLAEVERAKRDGRWKAAYASARRVTLPADLRAALAAEPKAKAFFAKIDGANRYAVLYRVHEAKKPETRAARIAKFVAMLARGETIHPPRRKTG